MRSILAHMGQHHRNDISPEASALHNESLVLDLHCHPTLPIYLFGRDFSSGNNRAYPQFGLFKLLDQMATDAPRLEQGGVDGICSAVYVPEHGILDNCFAVNFALIEIQHHDQILDHDNFETANIILDRMDDAVAKANNDGYSIEVATSAHDVGRIKADGKIAVISALEGGHMLGSNLGNTQAYLDRVDQLYDRGCAYMTIGHFFKNDLTGTIEGFAPAIRATGCFNVLHDDGIGLSETGRAVVAHMLNKGMIVDMTHSTTTTRNQIIAINKAPGLNRPLVFTHTGVQHFNPGERMGATDHELDEIKACNGVVGVISMNYWLNGAEEEGNGMDNIIATMRYIKDRIGVEHVAIGSDFDGFTDPCDDFYESAMMPKLTEALLNSGGFTNDDIKKILGQNVLRVLRDGWR